MYFFYIAITYSLLHLSLGSEAGEVPSSLKWRQVLETPYIEAKQLLSSDSLCYIDSILLNVDSSLSCEDESHLRDIYDKLVDIEKLNKLSNFFFKMWAYLKTSLSERIRNHPNFVNFFQSLSVSENDHSLVNLKRHYKWTRSTLFVVNFALLRQKLGNSTLVNKLDFDKISKQDVVTLMIDFIKSILMKNMISGMVMSAEEKMAFKSFLLFLQDLLRQTYYCAIVVYKPNPDELVGSEEIIFQYLIDGIIAGYRL